MSQTFRTSGTLAAKSFVISDAVMTARIARLDGDRGQAFANLKSLYCEMAADHATQNRYRKWIEGKGGIFYGPQASVTATINLFLSGKIEGLIASPLWLVEYAKRLAGKIKFSYVCSTGCGAAPEQLKAIIAGLGPNVFVVYGTAEADSISQATAAQAIALAGCVGRPYSGVTVDIDRGQLRIKSATMIAGYIDPKQTAERFKDGWFYPGDKAELTADGLLVLKGRI